jgi:hypothetical protein
VTLQEIVPLFLRQWPDFLATQHQEHFRGFLKLLRRVLRLTQRFPGNDRCVQLLHNEQA